MSDLSRATLAGVVLMLGVMARPSLAQAQNSVLSVEPDYAGGTLSYAQRRSEGRYRGIEFGIGGPLWNRMLIAGRHLADENGRSYEPRDGATDKELIELLHVAVFLRRSSAHWDWDTGIRASAFLHFDSSDDDPGVPSFLGGYTGFLVGNRRIKVGSEVLVGWFSEGSNANELGILFVPLTGRVSFGW